MSSEKPKEDRLREGITILKKLREVGIPSDNGGFKEIQKTISDWVTTGTAVQIRIPIPRYDRDAELVLPARKDKVASLLLKVIKD